MVGFYGSEVWFEKLQIQVFMKTFLIYAAVFNLITILNPAAKLLKFSGDIYNKKKIQELLLSQRVWFGLATNKESQKHFEKFHLKTFLITLIL